MVQYQFAFGFTGSPCGFPRRPRSGGVHPRIALAIAWRLAAGVFDGSGKERSVGLGVSLTQPRTEYCDYGYPIANQMRSHISDFATRIELTAPTLHKLVCNTLELFGELAAQGSPAQTLDDLAWLVHQGKTRAKAGTFQDEHGHRLVENAKAVVSAMFLARKSSPAAKTLDGYRSFMLRIFPNSTRCEQALAGSPWRVLTFNYDRQFELAFRQHFTVDPTKAFYGESLLNSGLYPLAPEKVEINTSRFSLLKLHGSVGFSSIEEYGECNHYHNGLPDWWELKYFGVLTGTDPNADPDHDGVSNMNEYLAGTNPTNVASYFHIVSVTRGSPTKILLTCEPGKFYTLL